MGFLLKIVIFSVALVHLSSAAPGYEDECGEDSPSHGYFNGNKIFMSVELTDIPWADTLSDHESDGFKELAERIAKQIKIYPISRANTVCAKLIELSESADILAKIVVKIGKSDMTDYITKQIEDYIRADIDASGILGNDIDVKPGSLIVYTVEKGAKSSYEYGAANYPEPQDPNKYLRPGERSSAKLKFVAAFKLQGTSISWFMIFTDPAWHVDYLDKESQLYKALVDNINKQFKLELSNIEHFAGITVHAVRLSGASDTFVKFDVNILRSGKECTQDKSLINSLVYYEIHKLQNTGHIGDLDVIPAVGTGALYLVHDDCFIIEDYNSKFKDSCKTVSYHE